MEASPYSEHVLQEKDSYTEPLVYSDAVRS